MPVGDGLLPPERRLSERAPNEEKETYLSAPSETPTWSFKRAISRDWKETSVSSRHGRGWIERTMNLLYADGLAFLSPPDDLSVVRFVSQRRKKGKKEERQKEESH